MRKVLTVAWREFLATIRTKAFILSVIVMPTVVVGGIFGTQWVQKLAESEQVPDRRIAIIDRTDAVHPELALMFAAWNQERPNQRFTAEVLPPDSDVAAVRRRVVEGDFYACISLPADIIAGDGVAELSRRDQQMQPSVRLQRMLNEAVAAVRMKSANIDPALVAHARREVIVKDVAPQTGEPRQSNMMARAMTPFAFMFLMFMGVFGISQGLLTSLIEEKSSRVIEVLLSAVSPMQLMSGKILGMSVVGFVLLIVWGTVGGLSAQKYNLGEFVTPYHLAMAGAYFVPGFLLMSALLAGIGSTCNELKDAQGMVFPLSIMSLIPMLFWFFIAEYPNAVFSVALSFIPPITPLVMILRICTDPNTPPWQIASTLVLLWVFVLLTFWAAAKVFKIGVLMYGKPPTIRELARWVREA